MVNIGNDWDEALKKVFYCENYRLLRERLKAEYFSRPIFPPMEDLFNALKLTPLKSVKAVILGQDPYPTRGQAHGLAFSVREGVAIPPSLQNIYTEIENELKIKMPKDSGDLTRWAEQGVLLLNTVLTVREGEPNSHRGIGWEKITDEIIKAVSDKNHVVFFLWGKNACEKKPLIDKVLNLVIENVHPSPLSAYRGFFNSNMFIRANDYLEKFGKKIDWQL